MRILRFIDWRFLASLSVLLIVVAAVQSSLATAQDRDRLAAQSEHKDRVAAAERAEASAERARILQGQRDLEGKYDRLIQWLNAQGIVVPEEVLNGTARASDDHNDNSDGNGGGSGSTPTQKGSGKQSRPKSGPAAAQPAAATSRRSEQGRRAGQGHGKDRGRATEKGHAHGKAKGHAKAQGRGHR